MYRLITAVLLVFLSTFNFAECISEESTPEENFSSCFDDALNGDVDAQIYTAILYATGDGTPQNDTLALSWFNLAADQNHAFAQWAIGDIYEHGRGVSVDYEKMLHWYELASEQGFLQAKADLARTYEDGNGIIGDLVKAKTLFYQAANAGNADAQFRVGKALVFGDWGDIDNKTGIFYLKEAATQGEPASQLLLGIIYKDGFDNETGVDLAQSKKYLELLADQNFPEASEYLREVNSLLNSPQIASPNASNDSCYDAALTDDMNLVNCSTLATQGDPDAQFQIGMIYKNPDGRFFNAEKAFKWLSSAAINGHAQASSEIKDPQHALGQSDNCFKETLSENDRFDSCHALAISGDTEAEVSLGSMFMSVEGDLYDEVEAYTWMSRAAVKGNVDAQIKTAELLSTYGASEKDYQMAIYWLQQAESSGNGEAMRRLAIHHRFGYGTVIDLNKALNYYLNAEKNGVDVQSELAEMLSENEVSKNDDENSVPAISTDKIAIEDACYAVESTNNETKILDKCVDPASNGNGVAQLILAKLYKSQDGTLWDPEESKLWMHLSAGNGIVDAQFQLGWMYENGFGTGVDEALAFLWYSKAAEQNLPAAKNAISNLAFSNRSPILVEKIHEWKIKAEAQGIDTSFLLQKDKDIGGSAVELGSTNRDGRCDEIADNQQFKGIIDLASLAINEGKLFWIGDLTFGQFADAVAWNHRDALQIMCKTWNNLPGNRQVSLVYTVLDKFLNEVDSLNLSKILYAYNSSTILSPFIDGYDVALSQGNTRYLYFNGHFQERLLTQTDKALIALNYYLPSLYAVSRSAITDYLSNEPTLRFMEDGQFYSTSNPQIEIDYKRLVALHSDKPNVLFSTFPDLETEQNSDGSSWHQVNEKLEFLVAGADLSQKGLALKVRVFNEDQVSENEFTAVGTYIGGATDALSNWQSQGFECKYQHLIEVENGFNVECMPDIVTVLNFYIPKSVFDWLLK